MAISFGFPGIWLQTPGGEWFWFLTILHRLFDYRYGNAVAFVAVVRWVRLLLSPDEDEKASPGFKVAKENLSLVLIYQ